LLVAIYELGVKDIMVIGHTDCGVQHLDSVEIVKKMKDRGISPQAIDTMSYCGVDFDQWLSGFENVEDSVRHSVELLETHPLIPEDVHIYGMVMDSTTGELKVL
ncbi:MAG: carbonic anhydrase, partial [Coprobacillus sp.]